MLHTVTYAGPFGYLKPWTAVRDGELAGVGAKSWGEGVKKAAGGGSSFLAGQSSYFLVVASLMRCDTSSLLTGCRVAISLSQASLRVRPGKVADSACGPAAVKFLDLRFIGQGDIVNEERVIAYRQIYEYEPELAGEANQEIAVVARRVFGAAEQLAAGEKRRHDFRVANLGNARPCLALRQGEAAEVEAPIGGKVVH